MIKVKNIHGTAENGSGLLDDWRKYNNLRANAHVDCCVSGCGNTATDGAHVMVEGLGQKQFIVPMCHSHNLTYATWLNANSSAKPMPVTR